MPTYVYECQKCKSLLELVQKISDESRPSCEKCDAGEMQRVIQPSSFVLKGSGWAKDGYK